uniref:O-methyltransferase domain-containing protein n=1 Tax=Gossypium raimondii TaxID=29730 RepID=A0A0D2VQP7_GOSRA|nr:hypothetical protein B456_011G231400 [Gossypium raimondii]
MDMVNANGEHVNELLQAQAHVLNHILNFINSMSLKCAIHLGIPYIIQNHGKPMAITDLDAALPMLNPTKDYTRHDQKLDSLFNEGMVSNDRLVNSILIDKCKKVFEGLNSLVDVGGGTRTLSKAIVDALPHLECIALDLPHVVANCWNFWQENKRQRKKKEPKQK